MEPQPALTYAHASRYRLLLRWLIVTLVLLVIIGGAGSITQSQLTTFTTGEAASVTYSPVPFVDVTPYAVLLQPEAEQPVHLVATATAAARASLPPERVPAQSLESRLAAVSWQPTPSVVPAPEVLAPATEVPHEPARPAATPSPTSTPSATPVAPKLALLSSMLRPPTEAQHWDATEPYRFVSETGHNLGLAFKTFYDTNGGVAVFGYPLTEVLVEEETGLQVQYFEYARMELPAGQTDPAQISLTRTGALLTANRSGTAFIPVRRAPANDPAFFAETGYRISGKFYAYWKEQGGVERFGYPVSGELTQQLDGTRRLVQYFERARLEYYPEYRGTARVVQAGRLGQELAQQHALPEQLLAQAEPIVRLSTATTTFGDPAGTYNAALAASRLNGEVIEPGATLSFLAALGDISTETGYTNGAAIVDGKIVPVVAGGICQTSTTLYRAAFNAGLAITERHPHSLYIEAFNDVVSFDAAVFSPGLDLRTRNDTPYPILVTATSAGGSITVELWGQDDGRKTEMIPPEVLAEYPPEGIVWRYDPELPPDATAVAMGARNGLEVVMGRIVKTADGATIHKDTFETQYSPVAAEIHYGANVTPPEGVTVVGDLPPTPTPTPTATAEVPTELPLPEPTPTLELAPTAEPVPIAEPAPIAEPVPTSGAEEPAPTPEIPDKTDWTGDKSLP